MMHQHDTDMMPLPAMPKGASNVIDMAFKVVKAS